MHFPNGRRTESPKTPIALFLRVRCPDWTEPSVQPSTGVLFHNSSFLSSCWFSDVLKILSPAKYYFSFTFLEDITRNRESSSPSSISRRFEVRTCSDNTRITTATTTSTSSSVHYSKFSATKEITLFLCCGTGGITIYLFDITSLSTVTRK